MPLKHKNPRLAPAPYPGRAELSEIDGDQGIVDTAGRMLLAHPDPAPATLVDEAIGIAPPGAALLGIGRRGQWRRRHAGGLLVEPLVGEIGEIGIAAMHIHRAAAIFVNPGAHAERRRGDVVDRAAPAYRC
jgi:hypothetical protein